MKLGDLSEQLAALSDLVLLWLDCLRQPFVTISQTMVDYPDDRGRLGYTVKLWTVSFLISLVLQLPMYELLGMDWQKVSFLLPSALIMLIFLLVFGFAVHFGLKANHVNSSIAETCLIYAIVFSAHTPFLTLLFYPMVVEMLEMLQLAKQGQVGFLNAVVEAFSQFQAASIDTAERPTIRLIGDAMRSVFYLYGGIVMVMFLHALQVTYKAAKYQVFLGASLGIAIIAIVPNLSLSVFFYLVMYLAL